MNATLKMYSPCDLHAKMGIIVSIIESHTHSNAHGKASEVKRIVRYTLENHKSNEPETSDENWKPHAQWRRELNRIEQVERWIELIEADLPPTEWCGGAVLSVKEGLDLIIDGIAATTRTGLELASGAIKELQGDLSKYQGTECIGEAIRHDLAALGTMQEYRYEFNHVINAFD